MPLDDHAAHWANYLGELVRELSMHYPSWCQVLAERKAGVLAKIGFDLKPHMESERWSISIRASSSICKRSTMATSLLSRHNIGFKTPRPGLMTWRESDVDAKSTVVCRQGSMSLAALRDHMMESFATRENPSLIQTFFQTHTIGEVFLRDKDRALYLESQPEFGSGSESGGCGDDEPSDDEDDDEDEDDEEDADS
nr:hypothetical protein [Tanacetum cinerariifolium]